MKLSAILFLYLIFRLLLAQSPLDFANSRAEIPLIHLDLVSMDTRDQIYASNTSGDIYLFDKTGKQLNLFSPPRQGRLQQLEAAWSVNIFSFSADLQEFRILDRFLNPLSENSLLLSGINLAKAATLGNNNLVWIWDESDLSLKRLDYLRNQVLQSQPLNLILNSENLDVSEVREFKNRLFVNIPSDGIYVFDNQANFLQRINLKIDQRLCFYKENLLWAEGKNLKLYSLSTKAIFDLGPIPSDHVTSLQIGQNIIVLIEKDLIKVHPIPQGLKNLK
jgi:hypothetical protein